MKTALMSLAVAAVAAVPGVASAATLTSDGATAVYRAAPREANAPTLLSSFPMTFADATAALTAGPGCVGGPPVVCAGPVDVQVLLGDRADRANLNNALGNTTVDGG